MFAAQRLFYLSYMANLMNNEPGSKPEEAAKKVRAVHGGDGEDSRFDGVPEGKPSGDVDLPGQSGQSARGPRPAPDAAAAAAPVQPHARAAAAPPPRGAPAREHPIFRSRSPYSTPESGSTAPIPI